MAGEYYISRTAEKRAVVQLNAEYEAYMNELAVNYAKALAQGNTAGAADISAEMADVKAQYQADLDAIQNQ